MTSAACKVVRLNLQRGPVVKQVRHIVLNGTVGVLDSVRNRTEASCAPAFAVGLSKSEKETPNENRLC